MIYDFETLVSRKNTGSGKWNEMTKEHPNLPENVAPLSVADMELKNPPEIVEGLKKYIDTHILGYTGPTEEYFNAVCGWMKRRNDWDIKKEEIVSTHGVVTALAVSVLAYTDPGDGVITMPPVYYPFRMTIEHNNRKNVECPLINTNETYTIDFDLFEKLCAEEKNKMFIFCNPHNPVGRVWTEDEIAKLGAICAKHNVIVVSDEIHSDLIFHGKRHIPTASLSPKIAANVVTGISATKTFNLAGLQASTVVFPNAHMKATFDKFWTNMDIHRNNAFSVTAMEVAFNQGEEWLEQLLPYISGNFDFVVNYCEKHIPKIKTYAPDATYLMWLDCRELGLSNKELHDFMIQKAKLGLNDGCAFGRRLNGYMRLNAACPRSVLEQAMRQLEAAVNSL